MTPTHLAWARQVTTGGIHEVLTALIRTYEDDAAVVELAAASLWPLVVGRASQQSAAVRAGVAPPLLKTMSSAPRAKQLQVRDGFLVSFLPWVGVRLMPSPNPCR